MADYASEQTLQDLLQTAKSMNASLNKLASVLGKPTAAGAAPGPSKVNQAAEQAQKNLNAQASKLAPAMGATTKAFGVLSTTLSAVGGVLTKLSGFLSGLVNIASNVTGILGEFAAAATKGNMKLSDMVQVMGDLANQIPIVGGLLSSFAGVMKFAIQRQEETLDMFRSMSKVGAGVGESLESLRSQARSTGLTMKDYQGVVEKNADIFAMAGGNVNAGVKQFSKTMNVMMGKDSEISRSFFGMGFTAEEAAGSLATFMRMQGSANKQGLQDSKSSAQAALELAQQMQELSQTTGKRRQQIQEELEEATREQNWQAYLAGLTEKDAKEAAMKLNYALQHGGKEAGTMLKTKLMTGITMPMTEAAKKQDALMGGAMTRFVDGVGDAKGSIADMNKSFDKANVGLVGATDTAYKQFGTVSALQVAQGKQGLMDATLIANKNRAMQDGRLKSEEQQLKDAAAVRQKIKDSQFSDAATLAQQTQNLREFGNIIDGIIGTLVGPFLKPILELTGSFGAMATNMATIIKPYADQFGKWFGGWVEKFTNIKSWEQFKATMQLFWEDVKAWTVPRIKKLWEEDVKPVLIDALKGIFSLAWDAIKSMLYSLLPDFMKGSDTGEKSDEEKQLKKDEEAAKLARAKQTLAQEEDTKKKREVFVKNATAGGMKEKEAQSLAQQNFKGPDAEAIKAAKAVLAGQPAPAAQPDQAKLVRDWAYSVMTGQNKESDVPASIKDKVKEAQSDPGLKKLADDFNSSVAKQQADEKAAIEKAAAEAKAETAKAQQKKPELGTPPVLTPEGAARAGQTTADTSANLLNTQLAQLIRVNIETAEATKKTANLIAGNGNLFRRG